MKAPGRLGAAGKLARHRADVAPTAGGDIARLSRLVQRRLAAHSTTAPGESGAHAAFAESRCCAAGASPSARLDDLAASLAAALPAGSEVEPVAAAALRAREPLSCPGDVESWLREGGQQTLLLMDTETTGLAGGVGTMAFVVGTLRISAGVATATLRVLASPAGEASCLTDFADQLGRGATLVTYNGRSFDVPLLATRFTLQRMRSEARALQDMPHQDLLHPVRRAFRGRWPDCRLATVEERLLGTSREGDLPGALAPAAWSAWLSRGALSPLAQVVAHNLRDLEGMMHALPKLAAVFDDPVPNGASALCLGTTLFAQESRDDPEFLYRYLYRYRQQLIQGDDVAALRRLARLAARRREHELSRRAWLRLVQLGDAMATVQLAKLAEHAFRDYEGALALTRRLREHSPLEASHARREARVLKKIELQSIWSKSSAHAVKSSKDIGLAK